MLIRLQTYMKIMKLQNFMCKFFRYDRQAGTYIVILTIIL